MLINKINWKDEKSSELKHFFLRFMTLYTKESSFTHHKCLVNCDCNDGSYKYNGPLAQSKTK